MNRVAEVIIIGGGVIGCSIAYHLAKLGCHDVAVLEKNYIGSGSTGKCPGGIRQQFSSEINVRLSMESVKFFERFEEETGYPADFHQHGYLMLATTEKELESLHQNATLQRRLGLKVYLLSPQEAKQIVPGLNIEDIGGATYCPTDGYADPSSVVHGFVSVAKRLGVKISEETEVISVKLSGERVRGVMTNNGEFEAPVIVNAAGPYAAQVGRMVRLDVPVRPSRRHFFITAALDEIPRGTPMVIDFHNGFWFRREGAGLIFGMRNPEEPEGFDISVDWGFLPTIAEAASHRLPLLEDIGVMRGDAGLHSDTPDYYAILGRVPEVEGLFLACGFSGHGFMHSPAVGRLLAEDILQRTPPASIASLSIDRFKGELRQKELSFI